MNQNPEITEVEAPPVRRNLGYGAVQVVALVVTDGEEVWPLPPHKAAAVLQDNDPTQIVALCGPVTDVASVQDAVVMALAYELRDALREVIQPTQAHDALDRAQSLLDRASPIFAAVKPQATSYEQQLAESMKDYDPSQTPVLTEDQLGSFDATPSESQPQTA